MSRAFILSFFPVVSSLIDTYLVPDDVGALCPEPTVHVTLPLIRLLLSSVSSSTSRSSDVVVVVVRNPVLALAAILGMVIGYGGARRYYHHRDHSILWSVAYACFGLMNAVALPLHCLVESSSTETTVTILHPWLWVLDCFLTGASSVAIILASVAVYYQHRRRIFPAKLVTLLNKYKYEPTMFSWVRWNSIGVASTACFFWFSKEQMMKTLPLELWYLAPTAIAGYVLFPLLFLVTSGDGKDNNKDHSGALCCVVGGSFAVLGLALDATLCRWTRNALWDGLMASTLTFWGCDIAFSGMGLWLNTAPLERTVDQKRQ